MNVTATYLNPTQQLRFRQAAQSHKYLKELNEATEEAVRCHDKYFAALEKVMTCLLNNNDILEEVRQTIGPEGATVVPTTPATTQLVSAYTNWKMSGEVDALRGEVEALRVLSTEGRHTAKATRILSENVARRARRCADVNRPAYQAKIAHCKGKAQEKLVNNARDENAKMVQMDTLLFQALKANSVWWSTKLTCRTNELYAAFARLGGRAAVAFPVPMYASAAAAAPVTQPVMRGSDLRPAAAADAGTAYAPSNVPTYHAHSSSPHLSAQVSSAHSDAAPYASGVPLEFHAYESTKSAA
ncbi:hypothetical protein ABB37_09488 [Leptomonas pyrrhocoris]|uniref:BAR domain-containing protein n=1 Tax=Leptomonas pyrrhocoris TaxID=157538 RepID=A0A0M9FQD7_LEPPY|nr:hypothetical protein ABB37_09488 [Leptomonas pyrrhocoris]XP_015652293.1 hypothetical protein ABB37_09488 [Leptomonas pyrrhocoris]KPA73853.1 hypothetical protein ABB37_09488 [Leptomonas pyrrhocoris]KPA73854.1 hypothetical protein ABB37_09488 [Leptomonas pyrrhocoris]|eukprot:XP_015652292.1 hypothetical protein ABB37_09488 [Leptomonas pyrrhocoris]